MSEQAIKDVKALRLEAQNLRSDAREEGIDAEARARLLRAAETKLMRAISTLKRELRAVERKPDATADRGKLRELLSHTLGSLGGTYRDAKDYDRAITAYDEGNTIEELRRVEDGHLDSYNLVQRIVVRLLKDQTQLGSAALKNELDLTHKELERQFGLGRRDSWYLADAILIRFMRDEPAAEILSDLESRTAETTFYESTDKAIGALLEEGLGKGTPFEQRLHEFRRMLQRRGGLKPS